MKPALNLLVDCVKSAQGCAAAMCISGGATKDFYGGLPQGTRLDTRALRGISSFEPSELVVSVRAGTPLDELEATLAAAGQCLAFEPPRFDAGGTVGGMVAAGLSGPARASVGALRDHVLGVTLLDGHGEVLSFGGQVIKNVAGYDVSRLMAGSLGVLGVILEVSLKVLPLPPASATLRFEMPAAQALQQLNRWAGQPLPLHASAWQRGQLSLRLAGARAAVQAAVRQLGDAQGGRLLDADEAAAFWQGLRDHQAPFFRGPDPLWRLAVPAITPPLALPEDPAAAADTLIEWGGAQRWLRTAAPAAAVRGLAARAGGHATLFRGPAEARAQAFTPLSEPLARVHRALKDAFDPNGLFNPGRLYPGL